MLIGGCKAKSKPSNRQVLKCKLYSDLKQNTFSYREKMKHGADTGK